jgi:hypothetical protein
MALFGGGKRRKVGDGRKRLSVSRVVVLRERPSAYVGCRIVPPVVPAKGVSRDTLELGFARVCQYLRC